MGMISDMINGPALKRENKRLKRELAKIEKEKEKDNLYNNLHDTPEHIYDILDKLDRIAEEKAKSGEVKTPIVNTSPAPERKKPFYESEKYKKATKCNPIILVIAIILIILVFTGLI